MRSDLFQHELTRTSAVFGRKHDIQVVFHGTDAATNGSTIYLPALALGVEIGDEEQGVMRGYVDHEAGHVRHSDMPLIMRKYEEYAEQGRKLAKTLHNALEDIWLERRVMAEYPGAKRNLAATTKAVNTKAIELFRSDPKAAAHLREPTFIVPFALTWAGRTEYGGDECQQLLDMLPEEVLSWLPGGIMALDDCTCTADVFRVSEEIERRLKADYTERTGKDREAKPEPGKGDGKPEASGEGEGEETAELGESGGAHADEDGDEGEGEGKPEAAGKPKPDAMPGKEAAARMEGEELAEPEDVFDDFEVGDAVKEKLSETGATDGGRSKYRPYSTLRDRWVGTDRDSPSDWVAAKLRTRTAADYDRILAGMGGPVNQMRRGLERALLSKQARDWDFGKEQGRLDARRFPAALAGRTSVFKERVDRKEIDTALSIVVDLSGSMVSSGKDITARDCAIALAEAVDRTGVAYEVSGFSSPTGSIIEPSHTRRQWSRTEPLVAWMFKGFEQRLSQRKGQMASLAKCVGGNNVDGEALMMAYVRLRARPEKRKVLMFLSDGYPAADTDFDGWHLEQHLRTVVQLVEAEGTQVMGIGIITDGVRKFFKDHVVVNNVEQLGTACVGSLGRLLLGDGKGVDRSHLIAGL